MIKHSFSMLLAGLLLIGAAHATDAEHIHASQGWIRVLPGSLPAGAYVTLKNTGDQPVALRNVSSTVYAEVMLHQSTTAGGMGRMAMVDSLDIPAHGKVALAPGGYHLMLLQATHPIKIGDSIKLTLKFADGSHLDANFVARPANALDAGEPAMHPMQHDISGHPGH